MPGFDGTGPFGAGALTGRGFGPCGRGLAFGRGYGRGFGWRYWQRAQLSEQLTLTREEQKKILEAELKELAAEKQAIEKKLQEL